MPLKAVRIALWIGVAVGLFVLGAVAVGGFGPRNSDVQFAAGVTAAGSPLGGAFTLVDGSEQAVTEAVFRDKPSAVFFGFTHCPDICPTTLVDMTKWIEALGPDADKMRFVFVTVDPERDIPAVLDEYVSAFSEKIVAISGEPEAVRAMLRDYGVIFRRVDLEGGDYSMDHSASVFLLDESGGLIGTIDREESRDTAVAKLQRLVTG